MKAPGFWQSRGVVSTVLLPFSWLYTLAGWLRWQVVTPRKMPVPVICVGNAVAGGAGKTPVALAVAEILKQQDRQPHFLSRGYGRKRDPLAPCEAAYEVIRVGHEHKAAEVGDEPLLLAQSAPCWVSADRVAAAEAAIARGATALIMDDGLQNPALHKDIALLVVDGATGFGNGRVMPAGPLREPVKAALAKAHAVIVVGEKRAQVQGGGLPVFSGRLVPLVSLVELPVPAAAFAGIGRPEKFFTMLREAGVSLAATRAFPDHHAYTAAEIEALRALGVPLVTTAKDAVKLPTDFLSEVTVIEVAFRFDDAAGFAQWLQERLA